MRIGFMTCVQLGLSCLEEIYASGGRVDALFSLHDHQARSKSGRVYLNDFADENEVPLIKFRNLNDADAVSALVAADLDWLFIIGWSQIAGPAALSAPRLGAIGAHPTLLPEGRGRASIPWAILKACTHTGVTLFQLDAGVDTGPILAQESLPIGPADTATSLYKRVQIAHRMLIRKVWPDLLSGRLQATPQDESKATTWPGRSSSDGLFDPAVMTVTEVDRLVRATTHPYPGAFFIQHGVAVTVWAGQMTPPVRAARALPVRLSDGTYWVTEWEERASVPAFTGRDAS